MIRRTLAMFHARNIEFLRDRSSLGWNILLPVLWVAGLQRATGLDLGGADHERGRGCDSDREPAA